LQRLSTETIRAFYGDLLKKQSANGSKTLSRASVHRIHATLHSALEGLVSSGRLPKNPAHNARPKAKKSERKELTVWTPDQLTSFLCHVSEDRLFALWRLLAWTGMRRGEAIGLKWDDLNLDAGTVAVRRSVVVAGYQPHVTTPKSGRSRVIDLDAATISTLRAHETRQKAERLALGIGRASEDALVFCREDGSAIHPGRISKPFESRVSRGSDSMTCATLTPRT
jgi:integrase